MNLAIVQKNILSTIEGKLKVQYGRKHLIKNAADDLFLSIAGFRNTLSSTVRLSKDQTYRTIIPET